MISPDEAITAAFRAASIVLRDEPPRRNAFESFLIAASENLDNAGKAFAQIAAKRPELTASQAEALERYAYICCLEATISGILLLGHFPYLPSVPEAFPGGERLL